MSTILPPGRARRLSHNSPSQPHRRSDTARRNWSKLRQVLAARSFLPDEVSRRRNLFIAGLPLEWDRCSCQRLVDSLTKGAVSAARQRQLHEQLKDWLGRPNVDARAAWEGLVWLGELPQWVGLLEASACSDFLAACEALCCDVELDDDPLRYQLLSVEMTAGLGALGAMLGQAGNLPSKSEQSLLKLSEQWLDGEGLPEGRHLFLMRPILASWTRCLAEPSTSHGFGSEVREQFTWLLRQTLRMSRSDGAEVFSPAVVSANRGDAAFERCLETALGLADDADANELFKLLWSDRQRGRSAKSVVGVSAYSEWGQVATLRSAARRESPQVSVAFDGRTCRLELCAELPLLRGEWTAELVIDAQTFTPTQAWEEVCWHEDDDAVYLELETHLGDHWKLQRHILVARDEGFALLADAVLGADQDSKQAKSTTLTYTSRIPLCPVLRLDPEKETNEAWLSGRRQRWLALPLALPEWRADRHLGSLTCEDQRLVLKSRRCGQNLFSPLLIPLRNLRSKVDYTWRPLTVGDQLEIQPHDVACAYRVQVGDRQWAVYRSLADRANRTFLGHNLTTEFFVGLFHRTGQLDPVMEVE